MTVSKFKRPFLISVACVLAFLLILPEAIRLGGQYVLKDLGAEQASIKDIDLNLFTGEFAVEGLATQFEGAERLSVGLLAIDVELLALFQQRALVRSLVLQDVYLEVYEENENWVVGLPLPTTSADSDAPEEPQATPSKWLAGLQLLDLENVKVKARYQGDTHTLELNQFDARDLYMWQPEELGSLSFKGKINGSALGFDGGLKPFDKVQRFDLKLSLDRLNLSPINQFLPEDIREFGAFASLDTTLGVQISKSGAIELGQQGTVAIALESLAAADATVKVDDIRWNGTVAVNIEKDQQPVLDVDGDFSLKNAAIEHGAMQVSANIEKISWIGDVAVNLQDLNETLNLNGDVAIDQISLRDQAESGELLSLDSVLVSGISLDGINTFKNEQIALKKFALLYKKEDEQYAKPLLDFELLSLSSLSLTALNSLRLEKIHLNALNSKLTRDSKGSIPILESWIASLQKRAEKLSPADKESTEKESSKVESEVADAAPPFSFAVNQILVDGESLIEFVDNGVTPSVDHTIKIREISVGELDSGSAEKLVPVSAKMDLYDHGRLIVDGQVSALQQDLGKFDADVALSLKGIELPELSAYIESALGYKVNSGQLNFVSDTKSVKGALNSDNKLKIQRVGFEPVDEEIIEKLNAYVTMPIDTALSIITDSDDTLKLDIPIKGDLSKPNIQINTIIAGAISQAVQNAAVTYFKYAVQPFGAILLVSETINDMQLKARFSDIHFVPGTANIVAEQDGYLNKVAAMIKEKDLSALFCVAVTDQDFKARENPPSPTEKGLYQWDDQARKLAKARNSFIKNQLIEQYGLGPDQVQSCQPKIEKGIPRAIMGM